eukprot:scaffold22560_cov135-Cylindrotheca_fusiformis.AAC.89
MALVLRKQQKVHSRLVVLIVALCVIGVIAFFNPNNNMGYSIDPPSFHAISSSGNGSGNTVTEMATAPESGSSNTVAEIAAVAAAGGTGGSSAGGSIASETVAAAAAIPSLSSASSSFDMAFRDSGGFFTDISNDHWALLKERTRNRQNHFKPENPSHNIQKPKAWYQENFEPDFTCLHERRIGGMGDGPKWVCDPHRLLDPKKDCLVYSVGSRGEFDFEESIQSEIGMHCEIHTFDPEMQGEPYGPLAPPGVKYHNWGFRSEGDPTAQNNQARFNPNIRLNKGTFKTMKETVQELGHDGRVIDIFKIDCDGCEWTTYEEWFSSGATLRQILVEVHRTPPDIVNKFFLEFQKHNYVTFHKEPNIQWANGDCVEYAFLKLEDSYFAP